MQKFTKNYDVSQMNHQYYDINIINNDPNGIPTNKLSYTETRNLPYIKCPSNYYVSIVRFSLQTAHPSIPVFVPHIQKGQSNPDLTIYKFYMANLLAGTIAEEPVIYVNANLTEPKPVPPLTAQDYSTEYYNIYSYQLWVEMMNTALAKLANQIAPTITELPFFNFDTATSLLSLNVPSAYGTQFQILCDNRTYSLIDTIPAYTNLNIQTYNRLNMIYGYNLSFGPLPVYYVPITVNNVNYYKITQESTSIGILNPVSSLVFTTALLSVVPNLTSAPQIFNGDASNSANGNNANTSPIITDFVINMSNGNTYKNNIVYTPSGEYRLIDCLSESELSSIEISVFWKDIYGNFHPFKLAAGCSANLKLMFRRKDYIVDSN